MFGIGKAFKKTFGKVGQYLPVVVGALAGGGVGALAATEALKGAAVGALGGGFLGYNTAVGNIAQEKAMKAQIESAEKIAKMQNANAAVAGETAPMQTAQDLETSEMNAATQKARRFSMSKTNKSGGSRFGRTTLG